MQHLEELTKCLYDRLTEAGVLCEGYYSDLHFESNEKSDDILAQWKQDIHRASGHTPRHTGFVCAITGALMIDVPFEYKPFWERVKAEGELRRVK